METWKEIVCCTSGVSGTSGVWWTIRKWGQRGDSGPVRLSHIALCGCTMPKQENWHITFMFISPQILSPVPHYICARAFQSLLPHPFPQNSFKSQPSPNLHPHPLLEPLTLAGTYKENTSGWWESFCSQHFIWNARSLYHFLAGAISSHVLGNLEKGIKFWYKEN